jgi:hypothetical protein
MAQAVICDGCGNTIEFINAMQIRSTNIEEGSIGIDLCPTCSIPVREHPAFVKEKDRLAKEMKDREVAMAQAQLEQTQTPEP